MALFNYATKEITLKIVYYGPGLSGKTTNIEYLHSTFDPKRRGKLLSLSTEADRTLFFDFLPVEIGKIKDFSIRFQLYTVPGQVRYNSTRKLVLKGADAVVFVADSQKEMMEANIESLENMKENLVENNIDPEDIPIVFQYNKRDLPSKLSLDELNKRLNARGDTYFESVAIEGKGVQKSFETITKQVLKHIAKKHRIDVESKDLEEEPAIESDIPSTSTQTGPSPTIEIEEPVETESVISPEELTGAGEIPSLEDLQKEMVQSLEKEQAFEGESVSETSEEYLDLEELSSSESMHSEDEEFFNVEEPSSVDTGLESEKLDLVSSEFDKTETDQLENLQNQEEILEGSTIEEFEPEGPSDDFAGLDEEEFTEKEGEIFIDTGIEKPENASKDDSIESIYKAFMSDEMEGEKTELKGTDEEIPVPPTPVENPPPVSEETPLKEDEPPLETQFEEEVSYPPSDKPVQEKISDNNQGNTDALREFSDAVSPSLGTEKTASVSAPLNATSEATQNVILDEINALSKTLGKMNNSISSLKSELNVLSDKVLDIEKSFSSLDSRTAEIKEAFENGSGSGMQLSAETLQTIMELKKTIDRAKKKKFWLLFS